MSPKLRSSYQLPSTLGMCYRYNEHWSIHKNKRSLHLITKLHYDRWRCSLHELLKDNIHWERGFLFNTHNKLSKLMLSIWSALVIKNTEYKRHRPSIKKIKNKKQKKQLRGDNTLAEVGNPLFSCRGHRLVLTASSYHKICSSLQ